MLNQAWVTATILAQYFGKWRTPDIIARSIRNSLCFGLYDRQPQDPSGPTIPDRQIGFCRIVGDAATFSYLADVVIAEDRRRQGLGRFLVRSAITHPDVVKTVALLRTADKGQFYADLGFELVVAMRLIPGGVNMASSTDHSQTRR